MTKSYLCHVGARVRKIREGKGMTRGMLAGRCFTTVRDIERLENGQYMPPFGFYEDVCLALGVATSDLFGCFKWTYEPRNGDTRHYEWTF